MAQAVQADVTNYGFEIIESQNTTINGFPASVNIADLIQKDPNTGQVTQSIRILNYYIKDQDLIYVFRGMSQNAAFNSHINNFKNTMNGFRRLTDPSRINVKPTRIHVKKATSSGRLASVLSRLGQNQKDHEELAIINGMMLEDQVEKGSLLKCFSQPYKK